MSLSFPKNIRRGTLYSKPPVDLWCCVCGDVIEAWSHVAPLGLYEPWGKSRHVTKYCKGACSTTWKPKKEVIIVPPPKPSIPTFEELSNRREYVKFFFNFTCAVSRRNVAWDRAPIFLKTLRFWVQEHLADGDEVIIQEIREDLNAYKIVCPTYLGVKMNGAMHTLNMMTIEQDKNRFYYRLNQSLPAQLRLDVECESGECGKIS